MYFLEGRTLEKNKNIKKSGQVKDLITQFESENTISLFSFSMNCERENKNVMCMGNHFIPIQFVLLNFRFLFFWI